VVWTRVVLEMALEHRRSGVETPQSDCCVFERLARNKQARRVIIFGRICNDDCKNLLSRLSQ
jgi:hypothetical protein